jgi:NAD(P)H-flavin reductase
LNVNNNINVEEKRCLLCDCVFQKRIDEETAVLEFSWAGPAPRAGQFFLVKPKRSSVFLGRPLSAAFWQVNSAKEGPCIVRFIIIKRGRGSEEIMELRPGEKAYLTGPLGNSWPSVETSDSTAALISGGVGVAPIAAYAQEFAGGNKKTFDFYAGFRGNSYGMEEVKARKLVIASEEGSEGQKGRILDFFSPENYSVVFACGPLPMLKALAKTCEDSGVPCFVSMEKNMACGTGACLGCTIKTHSGNKRCCADGPVFSASEINFE